MPLRDTWFNRTFRSNRLAAEQAETRLRENFDKQWNFLKKNDKLWKKFAHNIDNLIKDAPEYAIPDIVNSYINTAMGYVDKIIDAYEAGADDIKFEIEEGVTAALDAVYKNTGEALNVAKAGADQSKEAYKKAVDEASLTSDAMLATAKEGFGEALETLRSLTAQGLTGFTKLQAEALDTYIKGGSDITKLAKEVTPKMLEAAEKAAAVYEGKEAEDIIKGYEKGGEAIKGIAKEKAAEMGGFAEKAAEAKLTGAKGMLDVYGDLARQKELPGQRLIEEKLGSSMADAIRRIRELGGGEAGSLPAIGGVYSQQNQQLQDLSIKAAEFRTNRQADFANAIMKKAEMVSGAYKGREETAKAQAGMLTDAEWNAMKATGQAKENILAGKAGAYSDLVSNLGGALAGGTGALATGTSITGGAQERGAGTTFDNFLRAAGLLGGAEMDVTKSTIETEQAAGQMNIDTWLKEGNNAARLTEYLSDMYLKKGGMEAGAEFEGVDKTTSGIETGTGMKTSGYEVGIGTGMDTTKLWLDEEQKQFNWNELLPWLQELAFKEGMLEHYDTTDYKMGLFGDEAGVELAKINQSHENILANKQMWGQIISSLIGAGGKVATAASGGGG